MSQTIGTPPPVPSDGSSILLWARSLNAWLKKTQAIPGAGLTSTQTGGGRVFNAKPGEAAAPTPPHPWRVTRADDGEQKRIRVHPATIAGVLPSNILSTLNITGTGVEYVVNDVVSADGNVISCSLGIQTDPVLSPGIAQDYPPAEFSDLIAIISDGVPLQVRRNNLTAVSTLAFTTQTETVEVWRDNLLRWYTWLIQEAS